MTFERFRCSYVRFIVHSNPEVASSSEMLPLFSFTINHRLESQRCCDPRTSHRSWPHACAEMPRDVGLSVRAGVVTPWAGGGQACALSAGMGKREFTSVSSEAEGFVVVARQGTAGGPSLGDST